MRKFPTYITNLMNELSLIHQAIVNMDREYMWIILTRSLNILCPFHMDLQILIWMKERPYSTLIFLSLSSQVYFRELFSHEFKLPVILMHKCVQENNFHNMNTFMRRNCTVPFCSDYKFLNKLFGHPIESMFVGCCCHASSRKFLSLRTVRGIIKKKKKRENG
jgi:hypothetical protein